METKRGREGYWLNYRIILFGREQERPCPVQKTPNSFPSAADTKRACIFEQVKR